jgi:hypothetical protein
LRLVTAPLQHPFLVGLLAYTLEIGLIITPAVFGLTLAGFPGRYPAAGTRTSCSLSDGRW